MVIFTQCADCKHLMSVKMNGKSVCPAFPKGIPDDVLWGRIDHTIPIENDNGIQFEQI